MVFCGEKERGTEEWRRAELSEGEGTGGKGRDDREGRKRLGKQFGRRRKGHEKEVGGGKG